eukprot:m.276018 g.276018  ORF g.276018 m.276018 type:complete len:417 (-) comp122007_c0_seq1:25-1275(-)
MRRVFACVVLVLVFGVTCGTPFPFSWDTLGHRLYSFCSNQTGALSPMAVHALSKSEMMIHGMEVGALLPPIWQNSELKTSMAATQLRAVNPDQLQLYTVQIDYARTVYAMGEWVGAHPECLARDSHGNPLVLNSTTPSVGHCDAKVNMSGYPYGGCYIYGFDTECGAKHWVSAITDAIEMYNLDGVFIDGFQGCDPYEGSCNRVIGTCSKVTQQAWLSGLNASLWALHNNFTTGENAKKPKKIICNQTGGTYSCKKGGKCFCSASNDERWGGGSDGVQALQTYDSANPENGVIVHVPHNVVGGDIFASTIASFLLGASDNDGYGIGFGYDCETGGWLKWDRVLDLPLGAPLAAAQITNSTELGLLFRRNFTSGVQAYMNATKPDVGARLATCVVWGDGTRTSRNNGCDQLSAVLTV